MRNTPIIQEGTYSQLYVQIVFAVKWRQPLINEDIRDPLEKYICGIVKHLECKPLAIYCNPDHLHILVGLAPAVSVSHLAYAIKSNSSRWLSATYPGMEHFTWQKGYSAFSYSRDAISRVALYIENQPMHHAKVDYSSELEKMHNSDAKDAEM